MTYRVKAVVKGPVDPATREIVTAIAGCVDEADARKKIHQWYDVVRVLWVKEPESKT
jgi:hypothetical protein